MGDASTDYLLETKLTVDRLAELSIPLILVEQFQWCGPSRPSVLRPQPQSLNRSEEQMSARVQFFAEQRRIVTSNPHNRIVDTTAALCRGNHCSYFRDGVPLFADPAHLTDEGSRLLVPALMEAIRDVAVRKS